jgi:L-malate glycosyltransferase
MRLLFVEFTSAVSGGERSLLELMIGLRDDHDIALACPPGPLQALAREHGIAVAPIAASQLALRLHALHTPRALLGTARAAGMLRRLVRRLRPDVVHANSTRAGLIATLGVGGLAPVVVHCRDVLPTGRAAGLVRRVLLRRADGLVANSRHVAAALAGPAWADAGVHVVHNAVDLTRFDPAKLSRHAARAALGLDGEPVISVIAQITPWKAQDLAIAVLAELRRTRPRAVLLVVGEAKFVTAATSSDNRGYERELHALVAQLGLEQHVRFLGERADPERVLAATDALLVTSIEEPFGRTVIEAMAMGVPVAASAVGGPAELLATGHGGTLVAGRDPVTWAAAVEELLAWPPQARAAARAEAEERFSRARHVAAMLDVYAALRR